MTHFTIAFHKNVGFSPVVLTHSPTSSEPVHLDPRPFVDEKSLSLTSRSRGSWKELVAIVADMYIVVRGLNDYLHNIV